MRERVFGGSSEDLPFPLDLRFQPRGKSESRNPLKIFVIEFIF
jgi:hypothetical protein